jgi:uncharacterized OB-fold protein
MELRAALEMPLTGERPRLDHGLQCLVGSRCGNCGALSWPARAVCNRCGSAAIEQARLARSGALLTYTQVWVQRPGLEPPYTLGQVQLDDGPLVFTHVRGLAEGSRVPLPVEVVVGEEGAVPAFWVEPASPAAEDEGS